MSAVDAHARPRAAGSAAAAKYVLLTLQDGIVGGAHSGVRADVAVLLEEVASSTRRHFYQQLARVAHAAGIPPTLTVLYASRGVRVLI